MDERTRGEEEEEDAEADPVFWDDADGEVLADLDEDEAEPEEDDDDIDGDEDGGPSGARDPDEHVPDQAWQRLVGHTEAVYAVAVNAALGLFATGSGDDTAGLWKAQTSSDAAGSFLKLHTDSVSAVSFSADGGLLATGGLDGRAGIWDPSTGALLRALEGPGGGLEWVTWHPRGGVLLAGAEDCSAWMWNAGDGSCMQAFYGHGGSVTCGGFTPDGRAVVTASSDASVRVWSPKSGECSLTIQGHPFHEGPITCMALGSGGGGLCVTGSEDCSARVANLATGRVAGSLGGHLGSIEAVVLAEALSLAATASLDGRAIIWDLATLQVRSECAHGGGASQLAWIRDSPCFVSAGEEGVVRLWDVRTGLCQRSWTGHRDTILDLELSGEMVATASEDGTARVFMLGG